MYVLAFFPRSTADRDCFLISGRADRTGSQDSVTGHFCIISLLATLALRLPRFYYRLVDFIDFVIPAGTKTLHACT